MPSSFKFPATLRRGSGVIGLLIVVAIILAITIFFGPLSQDEQTKVTQAQTWMDRGSGAVCATNMNTIRTQIAQMQINSPGAPVSLKILEKKGYLTPCPDGGNYVLRNGQIFCTRHAPPPPEESPAPSPAPQAAEAPTTASTAAPATGGVGLTLPTTSVAATPAP